MQTTQGTFKGKELQPEKEIDRVKKLLYKEDNSPFVCSKVDPSWLTLRKRIEAIVFAVQQNVIQPVHPELLRQFGDDYSDAVEWFKQYQKIDPFLIRYGSTLLVFDKANLPPVVGKVASLVKEGKVKPVHPEVQKWAQANEIMDLFQYGKTNYRPMAFPVFIEGSLYVFDITLWGVDVEKYLQSWTLFNDFNAWR